MGAETSEDRYYDSSDIRDPEESVFFAAYF